eukprot:gnl/TRDRNA2_/TRDRNA2_100622_c1_seq1.p1 gnl/TRDRNA2_/TRDRNA2_100622_c1~~gnl/TRDRNA2_/TRDRNA2_100622_c1_seq1.p1  ORF type:complete len:320 (-),score=37.47 gnl/TRDRNA2_/TRDRNA2_100622_c1_seq1:20-853(-)
MEEGPAADGTMFAAQEVGNALGGSVALMVSDRFGYAPGCIWVVGLLALIFLCFTCRLRQDVGAPIVAVASAVERFRDYFHTLRDALFGVGAGAFWLTMLFACFPSGTLILRGPHCESKMTKDGLSEADVGTVELAGKAVGITTMLLGGFLSRRLGARAFVGGSYLGTLCVNLMASLAMKSTLTFHSWLLIAIMYRFMHGFHIGPQMSLFRSRCNPAVAATQFTMFCALCNNADNWGNKMTGQWLEQVSFQEVLLWDAAIVLIPLAMLPLLRVREHVE